MAQRIGVSANSLYKWVRASKVADGGSDELTKAKLENQNLKADVFDYIEMCYNPRRRHNHLGDISREAFERASTIG